MKISKNLKQLTTTQTELGKCLGLSQQRINQLVKEEVFIKGEDGGVLVVESFKRYFHLNKNDKDGEISLEREKALHERARREISELRLAKMQNNVYDARTVEMVMIEILSTLRAQLSGLPSKLSPQLEKKDKLEIYEIMTKEVEEKLNELSEYSPNLFTDEEIEDEIGE